VDFDGRRSKWWLTSIQTERSPTASPAAADEQAGFAIGTTLMGGTVDLEVPLNGEWSDLTAQFEVAPSPVGQPARCTTCRFCDARASAAVVRPADGVRRVVRRV
jgi:hypothetical protein